MKRKKIAILTLHLNFGGVEKASIDLANLLSNDYEVEIINMYDTKPAFEINEKVKVITLSKLYPNKEEFKKSIKSKNPFKIFKEGFKSLKILYMRSHLMKKFLIKNKYDIIISSRYLYTKVINSKKIKGFKIAVEHRHHNNDKKYINAIKKCTTNIDCLVSVSKELNNFYSKVISTKTKYIPNFLDYDILDKNYKKEKLIITVGRLSKEKGHVDLIKVFNEIHKELPDYKLVLAGDGVERKRIEEEIDNYNLKDFIILTGFIDKKRLNEYYKKTKISLVTSFEESFGLMAIEAGSFKVPVITFSTATGVVEIMNGNSIVIEDRNIKKMASKCIELLKDKERYLEIANLSFENSKLFSSTNVKNMWIDLIERGRNMTTNKEIYNRIYGKSTLEFYNKIDKEILNYKKKFIITVNPEFMMMKNKDDEVNKMLSDKSIELIPDGILIVKTAKYYNIPIKERITGCDLTKHLLEFANENKRSVYLFGSSKEVMKRMVELIKKEYKGIKLLGYVDGYVKDKKLVFKDIIEKKADINIIALGMPLQEKLIYEHIDQAKNGIFVGVGGSFDVISGMKKRAPKLFIKLNLEWFYRIVTEPKRLKRFYNYNVKYLKYIKKDARESKDENKISN